MHFEAKAGANTEPIDDVITFSGDWFGQLVTLGYPLSIDELTGEEARLRNPDAELQDVMPDEDLDAFEMCVSPATDITVLHLAADLRPGESGAPLFNDQHQVVGVVMGGLLRVGRT